MDREPQENSDLLVAHNKPQRNGNARREIDEEEEMDPVPPDGGVRAYAVIVGAFLTNGIVFGVINSYSVIYSFLVKRLEQEGVSNVESRACKFCLNKNSNTTKTFRHTYCMQSLVTNLSFMVFLTE